MESPGRSSGVLPAVPESSPSSKSPATLARILHNFTRTSENGALARVATSGFFTRRHDQTC